MSILNEISNFIDKKIKESTKEIIKGAVTALRDQNTKTISLKVFMCTQVEYDAIATPDPATIYIIKSV